MADQTRTQLESNKSGFAPVVDWTGELNPYLTDVNDSALNRTDDKATSGEVSTGTDNAKYITPLALANSNKVVPAASQAEVDAGTEASKYVSPNTLANTTQIPSAASQTDVNTGSATGYVTGQTLQGSALAASIPDLADNATAAAGTDDADYMSAAKVLYSIQNGTTFRADDSNYGVAKRATSGAVQNGSTADYVPANLLADNDTFTQQTVTGSWTAQGATTPIARRINNIGQIELRGEFGTSGTTTQQINVGSLLPNAYRPSVDTPVQIYYINGGNSFDGVIKTGGEIQFLASTTFQSGLYSVNTVYTVD